ncbi:PF20097 family protein [Oscillibacter sp.]|uniref:PF20097 family protein n=1 Tax=Oscillibacter sp. TaxID=1945593 RepID=UPI0028A01D03|nr:PF20097 family protein [Oscillibacter sp.]
MAFWNRDEESDWEKHQRAREKETEKAGKPTASDEFKAYFKAVRQGLGAEDGYAQQPGEKDTPLKTFLSRLSRDKPEEDEGPPEKCPWCGGDMVKGYLWGGRGVYWQKKKPGFFSNGFSVETVDVSESGDLGSMGYKTMWHCEACRKMVTDIRDLNPPLGERKPEEHSLSYEEQISMAEHGDGEGENGANGSENETEET